MNSGRLIRRDPRRRRIVVVLILGLIAVILIPLPFNVVMVDEPVATVWRLDGRLSVNGRSANPEGRWSFVALGRPELVGEALLKRVWYPDRTTRRVRHGPQTQRPIVAEPIAAAAGLRRAGFPVTARPVLLVEDRSQPAALVTVVALDGSETLLTELLNNLSHTPAGALITDLMTFTTIDGTEVRFTAEDRALRRFTASELLGGDIAAQIRWRTQRFVPQGWFRSLAVGNSHGLMVALVAYADRADPALGRGLHIAGTGAIRTDGTVLRIGGVAAKAKAAQRAGADVFFYPAQHAAAVEELSLPGIALVPVETLDDAIMWLEALREN